MYASALHGRKGRLRLLAERAASACQAAGYTHYVEGASTRAGLGGGRLIQRVYFTNEATPPARPCSFSATAESEAEAKQIAEAEGYSWPVGQERFNTQPAWTFEPGENDWGEPVPLLDEIGSPFVAGKRSDQKDLAGALFLTRDCSATLVVGQLPAEPSDDWWAYTDGQSTNGDQVLEIRVDGAPVKKQGRNATIPTAGLVASSKRTFGVAVRSAEYDETAAFEWAVAPPDRAIIEQHFPHCVSSPESDSN